MAGMPTCRRTARRILWQLVGIPACFVGVRTLQHIQPTAFNIGAGCVLTVGPQHASRQQSCVHATSRLPACLSPWAAASHSLGSSQCCSCHLQVSILSWLEVLAHKRLFLTPFPVEAATKAEGTRPWPAD